CTPPRRIHAATVRSSKPNATTMACSGQPCASKVRTSVTVSAGVRRRYNAVPFVALNVLWHTVHRKRCALREWMLMLPWPFWPLAAQARLGQNTVVGSMTVLLALLGNRPRGVCLDPLLRYKFPFPRFSGELPKAVQT